MKTKLILKLAALFSVAFTASMHAQPTAFTYQGQLSDGGSPASGSYDLQFNIYDSADGTTLVGGPVTHSPTVVSNGLFTVTLDFGPGVFDGSERWLGIGVRTNGGGGFDPLTPLQPITATPYAIRAAGVDAAGLTGTLSSNNISAGSITSVMLQNGAVVANLNEAGQSGVASGGLVLSATENMALIDAGYIRIGLTSTSDTWLQRLTSPLLDGRNYHTAVWTGSEMIIWGGYNGLAYLNDGGRYDPVANTWTPASASGAPSARENHTAVWTGSEMIVWGGDTNYVSYFNDGARYDPVANSWTSVSTNAAPTARGNHTAVWTGSEMVIWGGWDDDGLNDGGRYDPVGDSWTPVNTNAAPAARGFHTAVWADSKMIVWGGYFGSKGTLNDGGRYDPVGDSWIAVSTNAAPSERTLHTAVWTGSEMIIWGGGILSGLNDGGRYDPSADSWTPVAITSAPAPRRNHTAVWTGSEMIIWGGESGEGINNLNDGGRYDPSADSWTAVNAAGATTEREEHTAVWTGSEMIVWGGYNGGSYLNDTWAYTPGKTLFLYQWP